MNAVLGKGAEQGYTKNQYKIKLEDIIGDERAILKSGERALNRNARPWAKRMGGQDGY
jgi:hypothetical protein